MWRLLLRLVFAGAIYLVLSAVVAVLLNAMPNSADLINARAGPIAGQVDGLGQLAGPIPLAGATLAWLLGLLAGQIREHPAMVTAMSFMAIPFPFIFAGLKGPVAWLTQGPPTFLGYPRSARRSSPADLSPEEGQAAAALYAFAERERKGQKARQFYGVFGSDHAANERVARAWLAHCTGKGWHAGYLLHEIPDGWVPRTRTAIYIDCYRDGSDLAQRLYAIQHLFSDDTNGPKVRVLFNCKVDYGQSEHHNDRHLFEGMDSFLFHPVVETLDAAVSEQFKSRKDKPSESGGGRPGAAQPEPAEPVETGAYFLRIGASDPAREAVEMVDRAADKFGADGFALLLLAILAGPASSRIRAALVPGAADRDKLRHIFQDAGKAGLEDAIPKLERSTALEVAVRVLDRMQAGDRERLFASILAFDPSVGMENFNGLFDEAAENAVLAAVGWLNERDEKARRACVENLRLLEYTLRAVLPEEAAQKHFPELFEPLLEHTLKDLLDQAREGLVQVMESQLKATEAPEAGGASRQAIAEQARIRAYLEVLRTADPQAIARALTPEQIRADTRLSLTDGGFDGARAGRLLGDCARLNLDFGRAKPLSYLIWRLEGVAPALLRRMGETDKGELLRLLAAWRSAGALREEFKLLADSPAWRRHPTAAAVAIEFMLSEALAGAIKALPADIVARLGDDLHPHTESFAGQLGAGDALRPALQAFDVAETAYHAFDYPGDTAELERLRAAQPMVVEALQSADPGAQLAGSMAAFWLTCALDLTPAHVALDERVVEALRRLVSAPETPAATWRRSAETLAKLAVPEAPDDIIYHWAVLVDDGRTPAPPVESGPRRVTPELQPVLAEARRRLASRGAPRTVRTAAGLLLLAYESENATAARVVAEASRLFDVYYSRRYMLIYRLAQNGGGAAREALLDLAKTTGRASSLAFLALCGTGNADLLLANIDDYGLSGGGAYRPEVERLYRSGLPTAAPAKPEPEPSPAATDPQPEPEPEPDPAPEPAS